MNKNKLMIFSIFTLLIIFTFNEYAYGYSSNSNEINTSLTSNNYGASFVPTELRVNLLEQPLGIQNTDPSFSWVDNAPDQNESQTAYQLLISTSLDKLNQNIGDTIDTGEVFSAESSYVKISNLLLSKDSLYYWKVRIWNKSNVVGLYSDPQAITTATDWSGGTNPIWVNTNGTSQTGDFAFFRNEFQITDKSKIEKAIVSVTASSPEPSRQYVYNLFLNGNSIGMGPARSKDVETEQQYNTYDVTNYLQNGMNAVGALAYTTLGKQFLLQMKLFYTDGTSKILLNSGRDINSWKALDGTSIFGENNSLGTIYYTQAAENIDANLFPYGWDKPGFDDSNWSTPIDANPFTTTLVPSTVENEGRYTDNVATVVNKGNGDYFIDLGKEIVGGIQLNLISPVSQQITIHSGEQLIGDDTVQWQMDTGNNYEEKWTLKQGPQIIQNYGMKTFRYVEILNCPVAITTQNIQAIAIRQAFDDSESSFNSSNNALNQIYNFVKYTVKATSQNLYVDSQSRERGSYEGDTLISMLSSYAVQSSYALPRYSIEYLNYNRTWPAEYKLMSIIMAWNDYLYTGNMDLLKADYEILKTNKLDDNLYDPTYNLLKRPSEDSSGLDAILVDWPSSQRDDYDLKDAEYNTVFNSFAYAAYNDMAKISSALGENNDNNFYANRATLIKSAMIKYLYNSQKGAFYDGLKWDGTPIEHYAQHASVFPLSLGVVDDATMQNSIVNHIKEDGIKGSIYEAFFVLQGLYNANSGDIAMNIMTSTGERSWEHLINDLSATITPESWDPSIKSNMTFSHSWGSAPASQITSGLFGIMPLSPGFDTFQIKFQPGNVESATITTPTIKGTIEASYSMTNSNYIMDTEETVPVNTTATVYIPAHNVENNTVFVDGTPLKAVQQGNYLVVQLGSGTHEVALPRD
jgi:hypothetical protein